MKRALVVLLVMAAMLIGVVGIASAEYGGIVPFSVKASSER